MGNKDSASQIRLFEISKSQLPRLDFSKLAFIIPITKNKKLLLRRQDDEVLSLLSSFFPAYSEPLQHPDDELVARKVARDALFSGLNVYREFETLSLATRNESGIRTEFVLLAYNVPQEEGLWARFAEIGLDEVPRENIAPPSEKHIRFVFSEAFSALES